MGPKSLPAIGSDQAKGGGLRNWAASLSLRGTYVTGGGVFIRDVSVAALMIGVASGLRIMLDTAAPGVAPYLLVFPAIAGAVLLASPRSGLVTLVICQLFAWYAVLPPRFSFRILQDGDAAGLIFSTISEAILLWALSTYKGSQRAASAAQADRSEMLRLALRELDHRTKNNLQIIQSLLYLKAQRAVEAETTRELGAAGVRIGLIATMNASMAQNSKDLSHVALKSYLTSVCEQLEEAICPDGVELSHNLEDAEVDSQKALYLGLIVNELVTNAIKHAFPDGKGRIEVGLTQQSGKLILNIADNGCGKQKAPTQARPGLGTKLIQMTAGRIGATVKEVQGDGTRYCIELPG